MYGKAVRYIDFMHESRILWIELKIEKAKTEYEESLKAYEQSKKDLTQSLNVLFASIAAVFILVYFGFIGN